MLLYWQILSSSLLTLISLDDLDCEFKLKKQNKSSINLQKLDIDKIELIKRNLYLINAVCEDHLDSNFQGSKKPLTRLNSTFDN